MKKIAALLVVILVVITVNHLNSRSSGPQYSASDFGVSPKTLFNDHKLQLVYEKCFTNMINGYIEDSDGLSRKDTAFIIQTMPDICAEMLNASCRQDKESYGCKMTIKSIEES
ncbi:hypothetical protein DRW07_04770 [Alteromonas sediminis]|uniref:Uncharacterized protein n=1 Tax=Alteromonas sediminis TaxID=2259342 RepID=A0A3N5YQY2_9ALTE|nr:hypothetical protein [Alteromonas sediminis]RPJ68711.1 hypothetical protein DRW07_04770 [Alteromonas sediminis]